MTIIQLQFYGNISLMRLLLRTSRGSKAREKTAVVEASWLGHDSLVCSYFCYVSHCKQEMRRLRTERWWISRIQTSPGLDKNNNTIQP